jgi:hypothetical protein
MLRELARKPKAMLRAEGMLNELSQQDIPDATYFGSSSGVSYAGAPVGAQRYDAGSLVR